MTFEVHYNSKPEITNVNIRKEGAEHDILACDVDVKGEAPGKVAGELLGCSDSEARGLLWHDDIEGHPARMTGVTSITSWAKFENCIVTIGKLKYEGVTVKKFKLKPTGGGNLDLSCQIQISKIPKEHVGRLADEVREHIEVVILGEPDMFDEESEEKEDTEAA